ncbi:L-amino-acid oxidase-like [Amphiura filiformis]|uniref:L-amino-acid oxidase-like n=1 Tax=Amphiura filiformis TaxID=82378 RepID=UPI003B218911
MKSIWMFLVVTIIVWRLHHTLPIPEKCASARYTETLVDIAKNGLPKTSDPKHVIIIGAGIAGLTAGKLLKDAGHKVTILEASNRVGGRIYTYRDQDDRYYVDMGAMRISYTHEFVNAFVNHFNLTTNNYFDHDGNTWYYINGKKIRTAVVDENPDVLGFNTSSKEKGKTPGELTSEGLKAIVDDCYRCGEVDLNCLTHYDRYSHQEYLVEKGNLSRGAMSMISAVSKESFFYYGVSQFIYSYIANITYYEIVGGTDLLPRAFIAALQDDIIYNARVNHIEHGNGSVVAHYRSSGKDVPVSGDFLLTTATATSTAFIKFTPELDSDKREAFRNIHYVGATKIALVFERPFWKDEGIRGGHSRTDLLSAAIYYPSHEFESGLGVLIASYTAGDHSDKFLGLTDDECLSQALDDLTKVHGDYIIELYIEGVVKRWSLDPYSVGAFTIFLPYQLTKFLAPIVRPTNELFFAGEQSYPHSWMNTAIKSAIEAVICIIGKRC